MKIEIVMNREMMRKLTPGGVTVLIYCKAVFEAKDKVASLNEISKDLGMSFIRARESMSRIYLTLFTDERKKAYIEQYGFLEEKTEKAYNSVVNRREGKKLKDEKERNIWNRVLIKVQEHYTKKISSNFYFKTVAKVKRLIERVGEDNIEKYADWWIDNKKDKVDGFNTGIFCYDGIIDEFLKVKKSYVKKDHSSRLRIKRKKDVFSQKAEDEGAKILDRLKKKMRAGYSLDVYEIEMLKHFKEEGSYNGKIRSGQILHR